MRAHVLDPACALLVVSKGQSIEAFTDRLDPGEAQHTALETAHSVCTELLTVKQGWHTHRDNNAGRAANKEPFRKMGCVSIPSWILRVFQGKGGPENVFEKSLQEPRMVPCQSGNRNNHGCAQRISSCGPAKAGGTTPLSKSSCVRSSGYSSLATSIRRTSCRQSQRLRHKHRPSREVGDCPPDRDGPE